jgi:tRNA pseudouridine38-40 synthase
VQGKLIEAAKIVLPGEVDVQGAGRTDAGVHALGQVAHLEVGKKIPARHLLHALNDNLPKDIAVLSVADAPPRFHARHHAVSRSYVYVISRRKTAFWKKYVWWIRDTLDEGKMSAAARMFEGFHDFASFADKRMDKDASTTVSVRSSTVWTQGDLICYRIVGSHFLWKMVRRIVGVLAEAGRGALPPEAIPAMLDAFDERPALLTAPPSGLFLERVLYEGEKEKNGSDLPFPFFSSAG